MSQPMTREQVVDTFDFTIAYIPSTWSKDAMLKYHVVITTKGKRPAAVYDGPYSMGLGHIPNYNKLLSTTNSNWSRMTLDGERLINSILADGKAPINGNPISPRQRILPSHQDIIYSLLMDSEADNYTDYESWAHDFGYDPDSIKGLRVYEECCRIGRALRTNLGVEWLDEARNAFQDY